MSPPATMSEGPKLFSNKPKKSQLKPVSPSPQSSSSSMAQPSPHPPPSVEPPRESFARRYKFVWPLLLAVNLGVGAYLFMRTKKKDLSVEEEASGVAPTPSLSTAAVTVPVTEKTPSPPPVVEPVILHDPIPENQQRELYKWLLEEKRKVKPKDAEEKKRIDEEKAILKQFIRAKSIPSL